MEQMRIFLTNLELNSSAELEQIVNAWLKERPNIEITSRHVEMGESPRTLIITIFYRESVDSG